jgi:sugar lactone lactonase YvrE
MLLWIAVVVLGRGVVGQAQGKADSNVETVVTFDGPGPTENVCERPDGSVFVTAMDDRVVWKITPAGIAEKFASVPGVVAVIGIAATNDGVVVTAAERTWRRPGQTPGVDFSDVGPQILVLDKTGRLVATIPGPKGQFFNGIAPAGDGKFLTADTNGGAVWAFDLAKRQVELWMKDDRLAAANGIKVHNGWVYVSTRDGLRRIQIENGRPKGGPVMFAKEAAADDFDIAKDGTVYFPVGMAIHKVSPTGEVSKYRDIPRGGAAALVSRDGKWLYWPTRGGAGPQKLLRTAIP